jgi:hypothetical protein
MNTIIRNVLAVIAGIILGGLVNFGLIIIGGVIIPPPAGVDMMTPEGLAAGMSLLQPKHFLMPFLAHASGTFVSALVAALIAVNHKMKFAIGLGIFTLLGGIYAATIIPAPTWFIALDLVAAYIPMSYLGGKLAGNKQ